MIPLYTKWRNDFTVQRTYGNVPRPVTEEDRLAWYESASTSDDAYWFVVYELATMRPIGLTDLFDVEALHGIATFGMMIGEADCRGKGYGTETTRLMLDFAFTALGLHAVTLEVDEFNLAGRRAYARAGFREAGRRRQATLIGGRRLDRIVMDCLATEFTSPVLGEVFRADPGGGAIGTPGPDAA